MNPVPGPAATPPTNAPGGGTPLPLGTAMPYQLPDQIASQLLPGGAQGVGATAAVQPRPYDEGQLVKAIATEMGIKAGKGGSLEVSVVNALDKKFGVKIERTSQGTGRDQGEVGGLRHDIANWFDDASGKVNAGAGIVKDALVPGAADKAIAGNQKQNADQEAEQKYQEALKIKSPALRKQAMDNLNKVTPLAQLRQQYKDRTAPQPEDVTGGAPDESKQALNDMLNKVAEKMGNNAASLGPEGDKALEDIARGEGAPTQTPGMPGTSGQPQTAAEAYTAFTKKAFNANGSLTQMGQSWATDLENAGYLDRSYGNDANGPPPNAVAQAYGNVITNAVTNKTNLNQALAAGPTAAQGASSSAPTSEMEAFVQGVATEFGVGLTPAQITQISNTYEPGAVVATGGTTRTDPADRRGGSDQGRRGGALQSG